MRSTCSTTPSKALLASALMLCLATPELRAADSDPCATPREMAVEYAKSGAMGEIARAQQPALDTSNNVKNAINCSQQILDGINRVIPSFGGGILGSVASSLTKNLANSACKVVNDSFGKLQTTINNGTNGLPSLPGLSVPQLGSLSSQGASLPQSGLQTPGYIPLETGTTAGTSTNNGVPVPANNKTGSFLDRLGSIFK